jgi:hypothetical protein
MMKTIAIGSMSIGFLARNAEYQRKRPAQLDGNIAQLSETLENNS